MEGMKRLLADATTNGNFHDPYDAPPPPPASKPNNKRPYSMSSLLEPETENFSSETEEVTIKPKMIKYSPPSSSSMVDTCEENALPEASPQAFWSNLLANLSRQQQLQQQLPNVPNILSMFQQIIALRQDCSSMLGAVPLTAAQPLVTTPHEHENRLPVKKEDCDSAFKTSDSNVFSSMFDLCKFFGANMKRDMAVSDTDSRYGGIANATPTLPLPNPLMCLGSNLAHLNSLMLKNAQVNLRRSPGLQASVQRNSLLNMHSRAGKLKESLFATRPKNPCLSRAKVLDSSADSVPDNCTQNPLDNDFSFAALNSAMQQHGSSTGLALVSSC
ncbi:hypothetical protein Ciccas_001669 [Cichlidogyrus casuarinus]|uniref:Uncharacterized protein n=1 Tax=Cichlidogyrus casuarinus TaxID=1844966 RepID=A0ABD2QJQ6_9PLAT